MNDEYDAKMHKGNRRRVQEADAGRPVVTGALRYLGHRPRPKDEQKRLAALVQAARKGKQ